VPHCPRPGVGIFGLRGYLPHAPGTDRVFAHGYRFADGRLHPPSGRDPGGPIDEDLTARYPYRPASLPVNRLEDGTLPAW
jgi:mannonate dehydratase